MARAAAQAGCRQARLAWSSYASVCLELAAWIGIGYNCMGVYADAVVGTLGIARTQYMFTMTIGILTSACGNLVYGRAEQRLCMWRLLVPSGILATSAYLLLALATGIAMLYLGGLLLGAALALQTNNTVATVVNLWFRKDMATLISIANACASVVGVFAAPAAAALIASAGWRTSFAATFLISAAATVAVGLLFRGTPDELGVRPLWSGEEAAASSSGGDAEEGGLSFPEARRALGFWLLCLAYLASGLVCYGLFGSLSLIAVDKGLIAAQGTVVSAALAASAISMVPLGRICDRFGSRWLFAACMGCIALAAALLCLFPLGTVGIHGAAIIAGIGYDANSIPHGVTIKEATGTRDFSRKLGTLIFFSFIGVAAGPTVLNLIHDMSGSYAAGNALFIALAAAAVLGIFAGMRRLQE